jgi:hypothetical protein
MSLTLNLAEKPEDGHQPLSGITLARDVAEACHGPRLRITDLARHQCRWPIAEDSDGHAFCGARAVRSYGATHRLDLVRAA